jgi:hypothetical protein
VPKPDGDSKAVIRDRVHSAEHASDPVERRFQRALVWRERALKLGGRWVYYRR